MRYLIFSDTLYVFTESVNIFLKRHLILQLSSAHISGQLNNSSVTHICKTSSVVISLVSFLSILFPTWMNSFEFLPKIGRNR